MKTDFEKITNLMEEKDLLARENKNMANYLEQVVGLSREEISNICNN